MSSSSEASATRARSGGASAEEIEGASVRGTRTEPRVSKSSGGIRAHDVTEPTEEIRTENLRRLRYVDLPELRHGSWTRLGGDSLLGDTVAEGVLGGLAEKVRVASQAQGYATGWAEGRRDAAAAAEVETARLQQEYDAHEARRAAEHDAALEALHRAAAEVRAALGASVAAIEDRAAELAFEVTATLLGREAASVTSAEVLARALAVLPEGAVATVHLHPDVAADLLRADAPEPAEENTPENLRPLRYVADAGLGRADALVALPDGAVVDLRISTALDRLHEVLS